MNPMNILQVGSFPQASRRQSEDAYYCSHRPAEYRLARGLSAVAGLLLLLVAAFAGPWPG